MEDMKYKLTRRSSTTGLQSKISDQHKQSHVLRDTTQWVNNQSSDSSSSHLPIRKTSLPHHTSLAPGGSLQTRKSPNLSPAKVEDKRISAISSENRTVRDSQCSTTSTHTSAKSKPKKAVGPWRLGKTIGKGATGRVRKARHEYTGQDAAVKIISKKSAEMFKSQSIMAMDTLNLKGSKTDGRKLMPFGIERECVIMKLIDHPNIISLYDMWENRGELYLVLEHVEGGELFHHIQSSRYLPEPEAMRIFRQIIAALSYCHSFHICHRDLKPENILLDANFNVKLVDFGMAALQPAHQWLQTSCGSPHYACPEVIQQKPYRGDLADVWSAGVVLYAMLSGGLPFASDDPDPEESAREVIKMVIANEWRFPEEDILSSAAKDFVMKCLEPQPAKRMRTREMWSHPLFKRYETLDPLDHLGRQYIGPAPNLSAQECGPAMRYRSQIDGEILRNLRNLWHSVSEADLVRRLLSEQPNHERVMYAKLQQFQDRLLENYQAPRIDYSTSDYHHAATVPLPRTTSRASLLTALGQQPSHASQFSLLQPGTYQPKQGRSQSAHTRQASKALTEGTEESYDPFRPSRTRIASDSEADRMKVTILCNPSRPASRPTSSRLASRGSARHPTIDELKAEDGLGSPPSSAGHSSRREQFNRMASSQRQFSRGNSRITLMSNRSATSTGSSFIVKKAVGTKRNVTFPHQQRRLLIGQKRLRSVENHEPNFTLYQQYMRGEAEVSAKGDPHRDVVDDQNADQIHHLSSLSPSKSPRKRQRLDSADGSRPISMYATRDARKASHEFARLCDETFNRDSVASTVATPATGFRNSQQSYQTRATSISGDEYAKSSLPSSRDGPAYKTKPLPNPPSGQNNTEAFPSLYLPSQARDEVAKTAEMLRQRQRDSGIPPGAFEKLIKHLDGLMLPSDLRVADTQRRAASTPDPTIPRKDTFEQIMGDTAAYRAISAPMKTRAEKKESTIRLVENEEEDDYQPLSPIKPLTIRKKSGASGRSEDDSKQQKQPIFRHLRTHSNRPFSPMISDDEGLEAIRETSDKENFDPSGRRDSKGERKKRGWFRRHHSPKRSREIEVGPPLPPPKNYDPMSSHQRQQSDTADIYTHKKTKSDSRPPLSSKKSFLNLFRKDKAHQHSQSNDADYNIDDSASQSSESSSIHHQRSISRNVSASTVIHHKTSHSSIHPAIKTEPTNWLARFFRLKPATMIICIQLSRPRTRREILKAFHAWKKHGMRDVISTKDPVTTIRARVDAENALNIPPMKLAVEVHEVLFRGRKAGLSVARLVQEKGAKGSFERVARALEGVLREKGCLVEDHRVVGEIRRGIGF